MRQLIERILKKEPGLKAKEIAKRLAKDRTEVNAYLHKNLVFFRKDEAFCWFWRDPEKLVIRFDANAWIGADSFENSIMEAGSPLESDASDICFELPEKCQMLLEASARLLAFCNQLIALGKTVTLDFSNCRATLTFFNRMGFFDSLNPAVSVLPSRPKSSLASRYKGNTQNLVEFGVIEPGDVAEGEPSDHDKEVINQLTDSFVSHTNADYNGVVSTIFGELINNVKDHSETKINGFAALQMYRGKSRHIQTVVSDSGLGIATTLREGLPKNYPALYERHKNDDVSLVQEVLSQGRISRHGAASGRGLGFQVTSAKAMRFNVRLLARQETFSVAIEYKNGQIFNIQQRTGLPKLLGTHICFDFFV